MSSSSRQSATTTSLERAYCSLYCASLWSSGFPALVERWAREPIEDGEPAWSGLVAGGELVDQVVPELGELGLDPVEAAGVVREDADRVEHGEDFPSLSSWTGREAPTASNAVTAPRADSRPRSSSRIASRASHEISSTPYRVATWT